MTLPYTDVMPKMRTRDIAQPLKRIVTIGGGTGQFVLLSGLKKHPVHISAIVSMADDGSSTGILRDELGVLPPGDVRQCLVALSDSPHALRPLMNYRFEQGALKGHSFGNIFLSALEKVSGGFLKGVQEAMDILSIKGEVIPVTGDDARLVLHLKDGKMILGEDAIGTASFQKKGIKKLSFRSRIRPNQRALAAIQKADMIVIGPGDLYTSVLPNLVVPKIADAIRESQAKVAFVANITNKKGHTGGFDVDGYVEEIEDRIGKKRIDYVVHNTHVPAPSLVKRYEKEEGKNMLVEFREEANPNRAYRLIRGDFLKNGASSEEKNDPIHSTRSFIRHDSDKLARVIILLTEFEEYRSIIQDVV